MAGLSQVLGQAHPFFQHLKVVEAGVFAEHGVTEGGDQRRRIMAERQIPIRNRASLIYAALPLAVFQELLLQSGGVR